MGTIHLLEDDVINKIAAGEVVDRPASVVKELVENALDAGATQVDVSLEMGGVRSIVVSDNGCGLSAEDAELALRRHATSKIRDAAQLFSINTMGFRGEALASIAAVSRFSLASRRPQDEAGVKVATCGGDGVTTLPWQGPAGTVIAVENLFFNMPGRAKFLKAQGAEFSHCLELMQAFALCHPSIGFSLKHNGREQLSLPAVTVETGAFMGETAMQDRSRAVLGKDLAELTYVRTQSRFGDLEALVSPPGVEKGSGKFLFTFVNGRLVRDRVMRYGILRGYHSHLLKGRFPIAVVHLRCDAALIDVNVHPAKTEVKFQYPDEVQNLLALGIRDQLRSGAWAAPAEAAPEMMPSNAPQRRAASVFAASVQATVPAARAVRPPVTRTVLSTRSTGGEAGASQSRAVGWSKGAGAEAEPWVATPVLDKAGIDALLAREREAEPVRSPAASQLGDASADGGALKLKPEPFADSYVPPSPTVSWGELEYLGSFARCYLMFSNTTHLLVVDQHAFHERILYERLLRDESLLAQSQPLLVPEALQLAPATLAVLRQRQADLAARGFVFSCIGDSELEVRAVPSLLAGRDLAQLFSDLGQELEAPGDDCPAEPTDSNGEMARLILASMACHAAVRAGEDLPDNELKQLLAAAAGVDFFHNCPHGRRVLRWWSRAQVAQWFDR